MVFMEIKGKTAIVTGGSRGLGRAIAIMLARKGASVAINYRTNLEAANRTMATIREDGGDSRIYQADVSQFEEVESMVQDVMEDMGSIDILVNNSGVTGSNTSTGEIGIEEWDSVIRVNLSGMFYFCKAVIPHMGTGKIINMSSVAGKNGGSLGPHYAASKAGVIGLTFSLASELAPEIMVNAIAPGPVSTELLTEEDIERMSKLTPFNRIATPEEVAHATVFLVENDYVSGEVLDINACRHMD